MGRNGESSHVLHYVLAYTRDFNSILHVAADRLALEGDPVTWPEVIDFQRCIDACDLIGPVNRGLLKGFVSSFGVSDNYRFVIRK